MLVHQKCDDDGECGAAHVGASVGGEHQHAVEEARPLRSRPEQAVHHVRSRQRALLEQAVN